MSEKQHISEEIDSLTADELVDHYTEARMGVTRAKTGLAQAWAALAEAEAAAKDRIAKQKLHEAVIEANEDVGMADIISMSKKDRRADRVKERERRSKDSHHPYKPTTKKTANELKRLQGLPSGHLWEEWESLEDKPGSSRDGMGRKLYKTRNKKSRRGRRSKRSRRTRRARK